MQKTQQIDFVLPWVDGNNEEWKSSFAHYANIGLDGDKRDIRFRDWDLLQYWFRGVDLYAPWVRRIHFITSGELPNWLNINHPKINWVKHQDYIPAEFLPTFNINTIETNIHRIKGLSEHFVYFNDDTFLLQKAVAGDFFRNGLPCDFAILDPIVPKEYPEIYVNAVLAINRNFVKRKVILANISKWINLNYGKYLSKTLLLMPWEKFPGLLGAHLAQAFNKSTFEEVWHMETKLLEQTSIAKFRSHTNANQWLFRFWHLAQGKFYPSNILARGASYEINPLSIDVICKTIRHQKTKQICINDGEDSLPFHDLQQALKDAFIHIYPTKSSFEI